MGCEKNRLREVEKEILVMVVQQISTRTFLDASDAVSHAARGHVGCLHVGSSNAQLHQV